MKRPRYPLPLALLCAICAATLMTGVATNAGWIHALDQTVIQGVTAWRPAWLTAAVLIITSLGNPPVVVGLGLIIAAILFYFRRRRYAWFAAVSIAAMSLLNHLIKQWFRRPRPFVQDPRIHPLTTAGGFSFPSGHASGAMLLYGTVIILTLSLITLRWLRRTLTIGSGLMILLMGLSRIYVQVHYPSDVLTGWLTGLAGLMLVWWLMWPWLHAVGPTGWAGPMRQ